jgi:hypothetical protein
MSESATINVPGLGPTKSVYVYTAGAATLGVITYAWWSRRNAAPAVDPNAILADPALSQDSGGTTTPGITTSVSTEVPDPDSIPPTTNAEWAQRATNILVNTLGYDAQTVAQAIGDYLARQGLTSTEANIIRVAWGQLGRPPVGDFPITLITGTGTVRAVGARGAVQEGQPAVELHHQRDRGPLRVGRQLGRGMERPAQREPAGEAPSAESHPAR